MSQEPFIPPQRVPTLTEVVSWPEPAPPASDAGSSEFAMPAESAVELPAPMGVQAPAQAAAELPPPITEEQLVRRVLADVQRQVDLMLDYRLREMLAPVLARAADALVRETRQELAVTLRDIVARAVAQELARQRAR